MWWSWLACLSQFITDIEHVFIYLSVILFCEMEVHCSAHFPFMLFVITDLWKFISLDTSSLLLTCIAVIFSQIVAYLFTFLKMP